MTRVAALGLLFLSACSGGGGDKPAVIEPSSLGDGLRIRTVQNPMDPSHVMPGGTAHVTSAVVTAIDTFDETNDGKSRGTIYLQDVDKTDPFSGISLFSPSFQPSNLRLFAGDLVDLTGTYVELHTIGTTVDFGTAFLPQFDHPSLVFRSEAPKMPAPVVINVLDLFDFNVGRKWIGMLVTVKDVPVALGATAGVDKNGKPTGRVTASFSSNKGPQISNELFDMKPGSIPDGAQLKSLTGIVTYFFNLKIAPRSQADIVL